MWAYAPMIEVKTRRNSSNDPWTVSVLQARQGGLAERLANSFGGLHPVLAFLIAMLAGLAAIAVLSVGLGFLVTRVVAQGRFVALVPVAAPRYWTTSVGPATRWGHSQPAAPVTKDGVQL